MSKDWRGDEFKRLNRERFELEPMWVKFLSLVKEKKLEDSRDVRNWMTSLGEDYRKVEPRWWFSHPDFCEFLISELGMEWYDKLKESA